MLREWKTEWMKVRRRKIGLLVGAFVVLIFAWITWAIGDSSEEQIYDGWRVCFLQFALINTILLPTMIAMLASRLCDAEVKGNTLKLLCTMEKKGRLFDLKLLTGAVYLLLFIIAEYAMMFFCLQRWDLAVRQKRGTWYIFSWRIIRQVYCCCSCSRYCRFSMRTRSYRWQPGCLDLSRACFPGFCRELPPGI